MRRLIILLSLATIACVPAAQATTRTVPQLPVNFFNSEPGKLTPLKHGITYQAARFPIPVRVTAPSDGAWAGAQWKSSSRLGRPPRFGWIAIGLPPLLTPAGLIEVVTAYARTPSVATTVANLRTRGAGAVYQPTSPINVAGFSGIQFDGKVVQSRGHLFIPFSPAKKTKNAVSLPADHFQLDPGESFRFNVLNVRGKTVVLWEENFTLPVAQFPAFLDSSQQILKSLKFPG